MSTSGILSKTGSTRSSLDGTGIVVPSQGIREWVRSGIITARERIDESQIQPASLDLRLGPVAYELRASFLPGSSSTVRDRLKKRKLCVGELDLRNTVTLLPEHVYLVELMESLSLPPTVLGRANPRSTAGRSDLFTRLLCDFGTEFEIVPPGYCGKLYAEIVPRTFPVQVRCGTRLNQLRFCQFAVHASTDGITDQGQASLAIRQELLCVDLTPDDQSGVVGYRAKRPIDNSIDFDCVGCYDPLEYWEPIRSAQSPSVILNRDDFYIFRSCEKVTVNPAEAAELAPYDAGFGEFRVHYAGFLDPGFGWSETGAVAGTPVVLEVRVRDVPFLIEQDQTIARLNFYQLTDLPDKLYGSLIGSSYQSQRIALGKQFKQT